MQSALIWGSDSARVLGAALTVLLYLALCGAVWRRSRSTRRRALEAAALFAPSTQGGKVPCIVGYASQTGTAEQLAWQTAHALHAAGVAARMSTLSDLTLDDLRSAERALFIVSTYGEGDPPDNAAVFAKLMASSVDSGSSNDSSLSGLRYAVLALGDSEYKHFCGFGRSLDAWLSARGAVAGFDRIDVDNGDPSALVRWQAGLATLGISTNAANWSEAPFEGWELTSRRQLNVGSLGEPTFEVEFQAMHGQPTWQAGDLVQVSAPGDPDRPRDYSIASLPSEGSLRLLVRQERHSNGKLGIASGWLTAEASLGSEVQMRLRPNKNFQIGDNADRPLILIGNGTGLAGLRAHLRARAETIAAHSSASASRPPHLRNWLLFGERSRAHDLYWSEDLEGWIHRGIIERLDLAFSRDQPDKVYVQDVLRAESARLKEWLSAGAAIYICGSLQGMASGVHQSLVDVLGDKALEKLVSEGRYRRDVY